MRGALRVRTAPLATAGTAPESRMGALEAYASVGETGDDGVAFVLEGTGLHVVAPPVHGDHLPSAFHGEDDPGL